MTSDGTVLFNGARQIGKPARQVHSSAANHAERGGLLVAGEHKRVQEVACTNHGRMSHQPYEDAQDNKSLFLVSFLFLFLFLFLLLFIISDQDGRSL